VKYFFCLLLLFTTLFSNEEKVKHILLLNSYNQSMVWVTNITKSVYDILEPTKNNYIIHTENMDTKRVYNQVYLNQLKEIYKNKYKNIKFDLILSSDNNAFDFLRKNRNELFGNIPVSFSGVNFFKDSDLTGYKNYTGITEEFDVVGTLDIALKLKPNTKEVYIINDFLKTGIAWKNTMKERLKNFNKNVKITYSKNLTIEQLKSKLDSLSSDTIVLLGAYFKDKEGAFFTYQKMGEILSTHSKVPVFCLLEFNLKNGVIGGSVISGYYQGEAMSKIAKKILAGTDVSKLPVQKQGATKLIFNYNELLKHKIDINNLPFSSVITNQPKSYFKTHKFLILTSLAIITLLVVIIVILLINIKQKKRAQKVLKASKEEIKNLNKSLENKIHKRTNQLQNSNIELTQTISNLKQTQNKLIESEKMASLGGLVAGVAHEINTPVGIGLTGITHLLEITKNIRKEYHNERVTEEDFSNFLKQSEELSTMINTNLCRTAQLVQSFKQVAVDQTSEEKRNFNLYSYLQKIIYSLNSVTKKTNLSIKVNCDKELTINSYPGAYSQIVTNFIINTIWHGYKEKEKGIITIDILKQDTSLIFIYKDNGVGISKKNLPKIFDPFFTTSRENGGTGLGLNVIYNIVTSNLKGTIECKSVYTKGVEFYIVVPLELK